MPTPPTDNPIARDLQRQARRHPQITEGFFEGWLKRRRESATRPYFCHPLICPHTKLRRGVCSCAVCMPALKRVQAAVDEATGTRVLDALQSAAGMATDETPDKGSVRCLARGETN